MITQTQGNNEMINNLDKAVKENSKDAPKWLEEYRSNALNRFQELGIPNVKDEEWKYTNISSIAKTSFQGAQNNEDTTLDSLKNYINEKDINIVFINGFFSKKFSTIDDSSSGISISTLQDAILSDEKKIKSLLEKYNEKETTSFVALNKALSTDGILISIEKKAVMKKLIHILHISDTQATSFTSPRTIITSEKLSEATVLESHIGLNNDQTYLANALTDIFLEENAILHYCKIQAESKKAYHLGNTRVWQERNSNFNSLSVMIGSAINRNDLDIVLNGEGINSTLNGLYMPFDKQHMDNHTCVDHRFPNCTSNQLYKGILSDASRAVFNGKIFVKDLAQQTNSYQLNKNILLGKDCRVDTKPQLEIFADDVKCTHGATIGQLNEDELFYLQTRCIPRKEAIRMLSKGFINDLLFHFEDDNVSQKIHQLLDPSLNKL